MLYVSISSDPEEVEAYTDDANMREEKTSDKDFTSFDFSTKAYDIFKPNKPYEDRGYSSSGKWYKS